MSLLMIELAAVNIFHFPPASEASREVAILTERKNPHMPVYGLRRLIIKIL